MRVRKKIDIAYMCWITLTVVTDPVSDLRENVPFQSKKDMYTQ